MLSIINEYIQAFSKSMMGEDDYCNFFINTMSEDSDKDILQDNDTLVDQALDAFSIKIDDCNKILLEDGYIALTQSKEDDTNKINQFILKDEYYKDSLHWSLKKLKKHDIHPEQAASLLSKLKHLKKNIERVENLNTYYKIFSEKVITTKELIEFFKNLFLQLDKFICDNLKNENDKLIHFLRKLIQPSTNDLSSNIHSCLQQLHDDNYLDGYGVRDIDRENLHNKINRLLGHLITSSPLDNEEKQLSILQKKAKLFEFVYNNKDRLELILSTEQNYYKKLINQNSLLKDKAKDPVFLAGLAEIAPKTVIGLVKFYNEKINHLNEKFNNLEIITKTYSYNQYENKLVDHLEESLLQFFLIESEQKSLSNVLSVLQNFFEKNDTAYLLTSIDLNLSKLKRSIQETKLDLVHENTSCQPNKIVRAFKQLVEQINALQTALRNILYKHDDVLYDSKHNILRSLFPLILMILYPVVTKFLPSFFSLVAGCNLLTGFACLICSYFFAFMSSKVTFSTTNSPSFKYSVMLSLTAFCIGLTAIAFFLSANILGTALLATESLKLGVFITCLLAHITPAFTTLLVRSHQLIVLPSIKKEHMEIKINQLGTNASMFKFNEKTNIIEVDFGCKNPAPSQKAIL